MDRLSFLLTPLKQLRALRYLFFIALAALVLPFTPHKILVFFYTLALGLKNLILWVIPLIIFFLISSALISFKGRALAFVLLLGIFEACSNFSCLIYANFAGAIAHEFIPLLEKAGTHKMDALHPLWRFPEPLYSPSYAVMMGVAMGLLAVFPGFTGLRVFLLKGKEKADWILQNVFPKLIIPFLLGFLSFLYASGHLISLLSSCSVMVPFLLLFLGVYLSFLYYLSGGSWAQAFKHFSHLCPAGVLALSSGCSISSMPWTIEGTQKNLSNPDLAKAIIPATTNIQQVGDCITNGFLAYILHCQFMGYPPSLVAWLSFSVVFTLARFATSAVMGGAIFIMLPIYEAYLQFTPTMLSLILALNIILDPLVTSSNVMANGALCRVFERQWRVVTFYFSKRRHRLFGRKRLFNGLKKS